MENALFICERYITQHPRTPFYDSLKHFPLPEMSSVLLSSGVVTPLPTPIDNPNWSADLHITSYGLAANGRDFGNETAIGSTVTGADHSQAILIYSSAIMIDSSVSLGLAAKEGALFSAFAFALLNFLL